MKDNVQKLANRQKLTSFDRSFIRFMARINRREDAFFSNFVAANNDNYEKFVLSKLKNLPDKFSYDALEEVGTEEAKKNTSSNDLGIENKFYKNRLKRALKRLKGSQRNLSYVQSPEYNDLQLALDQFAKSKTNVLFVIPPVNAKWMEYTGLSPEKYQQAVEKIKYQLTEQGFNNIADFSKDGDKSYFMQDTIHMGWLGWLAFDKVVDPFVANPQPAPAYKLNDRFFSQEWAQYTGEPEEFK